ncbi:MAG: signal peptide peptidase SppA [archaeon]
MKKGPWNVFTIVGLVFLAMVILVIGYSFLVNNYATSPLSNNIAVIPIEGMITYNGIESYLNLKSTVSASDVIEKIEAANEDSSIVGIVLEISSPGGTVVASKDIANAVKDCDKPVVAFIRESGASGAYWIASASDYIIADPLSITGSLAVVGSYLDFEGLFDDYGINYNRLVTGEYKDTGSPFKSLSSLEEDLLMERMDLIHDYFVSAVAENRGMEEAEVASLANGAFYLGIQAVDLGLVDATGTKDDAVEKLKELAEVENAVLVKFQDQASFFDYIMNKVTVQGFYFLGQGIGDSLLVESGQDSLELSL